MATCTRQPPPYCGHFLSIAANNFGPKGGRLLCAFLQCNHIQQALNCANMLREYLDMCQYWHSSGFEVVGCHATIVVIVEPKDNSEVCTFRPKMAVFNVVVNTEVENYNFVCMWHAAISVCEWSECKIWDIRCRISFQDLGLFSHEPTHS